MDVTTPLSGKTTPLSASPPSRGSMSATSTTVTARSWSAVESLPQKLGLTSIVSPVIMKSMKYPVTIMTSREMTTTTSQRGTSCMNPSLAGPAIENLVFPLSGVVTAIAGLQYMYRGLVWLHRSGLDGSGRGATPTDASLPEDDGDASRRASGWRHQ